MKMQMCGAMRRLKPSSHEHMKQTVSIMSSMWFSIVDLQCWRLHWLQNQLHQLFNLMPPNFFKANFLEMCLKCVCNLDGKSKCKLQASGWVFPFFCTISESRHRAGYEPLLLYNINYSESSHYAIKTSLYFTWKIVRKLQHKESFCLLVPKVSEEQNEAHKFFYIRIHFINWLF